MWESAFVGAGLARDAGASICQEHRGDAIAGKPGSYTSAFPQGKNL